MKTIYILEGCDSMGKTTLSNKIIEKYNAHYIHCSFSNDMNKYFMVKYMEKKWLEALDKAIYQDVILDRHVISTIIYENVYRLGIENRPEVKVFAHKILETMSTSKNIKTILCHLDFEDWKNNFIKSQEIEGKIEMYKLDSKLENIYNEYDYIKNNNCIKGFEQYKLNYQLHDFIKNPIIY